MRLPRLPRRESAMPLKKSFLGTDDEVVADEDEDETGEAGDPAPDAPPPLEPLAEPEATKQP